MTKPMSITDLSSIRMIVCEQRAEPAQCAAPSTSALQFRRTYNITSIDSDSLYLNYLFYLFLLL